ncbi:MAG TPA: alpha-amylase family glycosyl hydrolase [Ferruginibacter sp.]|jgi:glycosidase|nr:alpha-amylase family glycosyl hydrolase [Ferruginibacter sp.]
MKKYILFWGIVLLMSCSKKSAGPVQYGTPYTNIPATSDISMYEVNERAYSATGDFNGITQRLDSIKALGINVIWLMPINPIGQIKSVNSPYCVKDHLGLNTEFGSLSDLRNLISTAHSKNMAVILDWAANQTSWDNAWITEHKSWYLQDINGNIISPPGTTFTDVAQLDYTNYAMRAEMIKDMEYWIHTANFDGFRCDFADNIPDNFWAQAIDSLNNIQPSRQLILLAEGYNVGHLTAGFQMVFSEGTYSALVSAFSTASPGTPASIYSANTAEYSGVPAGKQRLRFTTTHDHSAFDGTPMTVFNGKSGALAASVITLNMAGVPMIYGSQEVGQVAEVPFFYDSPIDWTQNPDMVAAYKTILAFHNSSAVLKTGALQTFTDANVVCYLRTLATDSVLVIANIRNSSEVFSIPAALQNTNWTNAYDSTSVSLTTTVSLAPYQYLVLKNY